MDVCITCDDFLDFAWLYICFILYHLRTLFGTTFDVLDSNGELYHKLAFIGQITYLAS